MRRLLPLLLLGGCSGCDHAPAAKPTPAYGADVVFAVDGIEFTAAELQPYVDFYGQLFPEWGAQARMRHVLEMYLLPLKFARRDFRAARAEQLAAAKALRAVADNAPELRQRSANLRVVDKTSLAAQQLDAPTAMFLFDRALLGSVSQPIEVPQGWILATAFNLHESNGKHGGLVGDDLVDALQVGFFAADDTTYDAWYRKLLADLAQKKASYVNPAYRDAVPGRLLP